MRKFPLLSVLSAAMLLWACNSSEKDGDADESFSVKFSLASVPSGLTLDSLEISIALGDTDRPQGLTIDLETGKSKAQVMAYPGQTYALTYRLYASGFEIGKGRDSGALARDMNIELSPVWDYGKVALAMEARRSGNLLPPYLDVVFDKALAGETLRIAIDTATGMTYTWYVRQGDSVIASGTGPMVSWTVPDSLAGSKVNVKIVVKSGSTVKEERSWDVNIVGAVAADRVQSMVAKNDTASDQGTLTYFKYNPEGKPDSVLIYDTTARDPARQPVASLAYTYTNAHRPDGDPVRVVRSARNQADVDSAFSYDSQGGLTAITVTLASGTTVDSLFHPSDKETVVRSYAQGRLNQVVKSAKVSGTEQIDSVFSPGDTGLKVSGLIQYTLNADLVSSKRVFHNVGGLTPFESERFVYNGLGALALRYLYSEGAGLTLEESETRRYDGSGRLERILNMDEAAGELLLARYYLYAGASKTLAKRGLPTVSERAEPLGWPARLAEVRRHFPGTVTAGAYRQTQPEIHSQCEETICMGPIPE